MVFGFKLNILVAIESYHHISPPSIATINYLIIIGCGDVAIENFKTKTL